MQVTVVGLGKIGLPLAAQYASRGATVFGADTSERVVELVNQAKAPFPNEPGLEERIAEAIAARGLSATSDTRAAVSQSDVVVVTVPVVVHADGRPDLGAMLTATAAIGSGLQPGALVIFETTLPVGTTRQQLIPLLASSSGLLPGQDFFVCYSPERVMSGRVFADLRRYPKLVGGLDDASRTLARGFYESVLEFDEREDLSRPNGVWDLGSIEAAELTKLAETTYRDVNIALANEFARFADRIGIDIRSVIEGANSQPYSHLHSPGIAVGGHCIPVYPQLYLSADPDAVLPRASRAVNEAMPAYAIETLQGLLGGLAGATIVILGATYRGGVKETAFSGAFALAAGLKNAGAKVLVHDPLYSHEELTSLGFDPYSVGVACDAAILQADHIEYAAFGPGDLPGVRAVIDGRDYLDAANWRGVTVKSLGRPVQHSQ